MTRTLRLTLALALASFAGLAGLGFAAATAARAQPVAAGTAPAGAAQPLPVAARWQDSFAAFDAADAAAAPRPGGVVFVGSSSIRLWNDLEQQFQDPIAVTKRGFGGSRLLDCAEHVQRLVLPYKPRLVVVYAGDNDLAEGRSPEQVLASFQAFVTGVHAALPQTRIAYLSIKPSPLRATLMPAVQRTNALIADYSASRPLLSYVDVYTRMLGTDGRPRAELFSKDALHLNAEGYALWKSVIEERLHDALQAPRAAAATAPARALLTTSAAPPAAP